MSRRILSCLILLLLLASCSGPAYTPPESALDAGRQFAEAIFKGNFKRAGDLIVPDGQNQHLLAQRLEQDFHRRTGTDREQLAQSSLQILNVDNVIRDSVTVIRFINSYDGRPAILKVVKADGKWLVDLKYTFSGNL